MSRNKTSRPWWGLSEMAARVRALRETVAEETQGKLPPDLSEDRVGNAPKEKKIVPFSPPRKGRPYHRRVKR